MATVHRLVCGGSNLIVRADDTTGDGIIDCPDCRRRQTTTLHPEQPLMAGRRTIDAHTARHLPRCRDDDGKIECVCGLDDQVPRYDAEGRCL